MTGYEPFFQGLMALYLCVRCLGAWGLTMGGEDCWLVWRKDGEITKAKRVKSTSSYTVIGFEIAVLWAGGFFSF